MNSSNDNIHTASSVAQDEKVRVSALGSGARSKSKLHFPPQADRYWKPINAFATLLGRQIGAMQSICTRVGPKHRDLRMGNWNITSLNEKKQELIWEAEQLLILQKRL